MQMGGYSPNGFSRNDPPVYRPEDPVYDPPTIDSPDIDFPDLDKIGDVKDFYDSIRDTWEEINRERGGGYIPPDVNVGWGHPSPGLPPGTSAPPYSGIIIPPLIPPYFGERPGLSPPDRRGLIEAPDEGYEVLNNPWRIPLYIDMNWMGGSLFGGTNNGFGTIGGAFIE